VVTVAAVAAVSALAARVAFRGRSARRQVAETVRNLGTRESCALSVYLGPGLFEQYGLAWPTFPLEAPAELALLVEQLDADELDLVARNLPAVLELGRLDRPPAARCRVVGLDEVRQRREQVS
jgi:hypothetical protein